MDMDFLPPANDDKPKHPWQSKKNIYLCTTCGHGFVSLDLDGGTTPFMTSCRQKGCNGHARSLMYGCPQEALADVPPAVEWYAPTKRELLNKSLSVKEHVRKGGLLARPHRPGGTQ